MAARLDALDRVEDQLEVFGRRRHEVDDVMVDGHNADAVALLAREVAQTRRQIARVVELADPIAGVIHRSRDVEDDDEVRVRVRLELLDVETVGAAKDSPVDAPNVVARHVRSMLREIDRQTQIRRAVKAVDEAVHHGAGQQLEVVDPRQHLGLQKARSSHKPDFGTGIASIS